MKYLKLYEAFSGIRFVEGNSGGFKKILCFNNDERVGFSIYEIYSKEEGNIIINNYVTKDIYDKITENIEKFGIVLGIEIYKEFQNLKFGKELFIETLKIIKSNGCNFILVEAEPLGSKTKSINELTEWYKSFGFEMLTNNPHSKIDNIMIKYLN